MREFLHRYFDLFHLWVYSDDRSTRACSKCSKKEVFEVDHGGWTVGFWVKKDTSND